MSIEEFERPLDELEQTIQQVRRAVRDRGSADPGLAEKLAELERRYDQLLREVHKSLTRWDRTWLARHPRRPYTLDYIRLIFQDFVELHGDRRFGDDGAIVGGMARLGDQWTMLVGQQKGRDAAERHRRNSGCARPEGYRKAMRLMRLAEKFGRPIICLIDTTAADPGVGSEERGISEAIAANIRDMFLLRVPVLAVVTGEGGSGGALGIGIGDRLLMLEHATYSVIPPEGCAAILWRDPRRACDAAEALRLSAEDAQAFGVVDEIVPEPAGAAHRDPEAMARRLGETLARHLAELQALPAEELLEKRYRKYRDLGVFQTVDSAGTSE